MDQTLGVLTTRTRCGKNARVDKCDSGSTGVLDVTSTSARKAGCTWWWVNQLTLYILCDIWVEWNILCSKIYWEHILFRWSNWGDVCSESKCTLCQASRPLAPVHHFCCVFCIIAKKILFLNVLLAINFTTLIKEIYVLCSLGKKKVWTPLLHPVSIPYQYQHCHENLKAHRLLMVTVYRNYWCSLHWFGTHWTGVSGIPRGGSTPPPEIPKAPQNHAKLNPIVKTVKNCWI